MGIDWNKIPSSRLGGWDLEPPGRDGLSQEVFLSALWMEIILQKQELLYGNLEIFHYTWGHANLFAYK